jgi:hypothetical protein
MSFSISPAGTEVYLFSRIVDLLGQRIEVVVFMLDWTLVVQAWMFSSGQRQKLRNKNSGVFKRFHRCHVEFSLTAQVKTHSSLATFSYSNTFAKQKVCFFKSPHVYPFVFRAFTIKRRVIV